MNAPGRWMDPPKLGMDALRVIGFVSPRRADRSHPFVPSGRGRRTGYNSPRNHPINSTAQILRLAMTPERVGLPRKRARRLCLLLQAATLACSRCQRSSRFQQISESLRAVATRAMLLLERFLIRVWKFFNATSCRTTLITASTRTQRSQGEP